jgi:CubicO group peptidase (beta-lactamase class C family)
MLHANRWVFVGSVLILLCSGCGGGTAGGGAGNKGAQTCPPRSVSSQPPGSLAAIVDAAAAAEMGSAGMPGMSVAVAKNGTILYAQGYGYADLTSCEPMTANAEMQIGSITKQFTAAASLQLQQAGVLNLDQALVVYLPGYSFDPHITLRMLLNQTSGLQDYLGFPSLQQYAATGAPESVVLNAVAQAPLLFSPGTAYAYSNSNYYLLGSVIEAVTGQSYSNYLIADVFPLAGLTSTSYLRPTPSASPYKAGTDGPVPGTIPDPSAYFAAGQLWSNVQDLAAWDGALLAGRVIPPALFDLMLTPAPVPYFQQSLPSDYGMGWVVSGSLSGHPFAWHNGQTTSYTSFNGLLTDDGFSVTVLTNYPVNETAPLLTFGQGLIQTICSTATTSGGC